MATTLLVTNLTTSDLPVQGMGNVPASSSKSREYNDVDLDPMLAGLDRAARAGWLTYTLSPGSRSVRSIDAVAGAPTPDASNLGVESYLLVDATDDDVDVQLPTAVGCSGRRLTVKRSDAANAITLTPDGTETIDGVAAALTMAVAAGQTVVLISDGSNWQSIFNEVSP